MTLLEVLVALAILSLGLTALFNTVSLGTRTASLAEQQQAATEAAQSLLAELGRSRPIMDGTSTGAFPTGQAWQLDIGPFQTPDTQAAPLLQGHAVQLTVSWPDGNGRPRSLAFRTLLLAAAP